jgi:hypothetical protein
MPMAKVTVAICEYNFHGLFEGNAPRRGTDKDTHRTQDRLVHKIRADKMLAKAVSKNV